MDSYQAMTLSMMYHVQNVQEQGPKFKGDAHLLGHYIQPCSSNPFGVTSRWRFL